MVLDAYYLFRTMILSRRPKDDDSRDGYTNWPFMTTHTWGENPRGKWRLFVRFQVRHHSKPLHANAI
jgi:proprotein convertase subtilisin/kexin type 2